LCLDINGIYRGLQQEYNPTVDGSSSTLRSEVWKLSSLTQNPDLPFCALIETREFIKILPDAIQYNVHSGISVRYEGNWYVGADARRLEVLLFLMPLG